MGGRIGLHEAIRIDCVALQNLSLLPDADVNNACVSEIRDSTAIGHVAVCVHESLVTDIQFVVLPVPLSEHSIDFLLLAQLGVLREENMRQTTHEHFANLSS